MRASTHQEADDEDDVGATAAGVTMSPVPEKPEKPETGDKPRGKNAGKRKREKAEKPEDDDPKPKPSKDHAGDTCECCFASLRLLHDDFIVHGSSLGGR